MVGVAGFEPTASSSRTRRATNCATPRNKNSSSTLELLLFIWLEKKDSNPHKQSQSLSCYPYTILHRVVRLFTERYLLYRYILILQAFFPIMYNFFFLFFKSAVFSVHIAAFRPLYSGILNIKQPYPLMRIRLFAFWKCPPEQCGSGKFSIQRKWGNLSSISIMI